MCVERTRGSLLCKMRGFMKLQHIGYMGSDDI